MLKSLLAAVVGVGLSVGSVASASVILVDFGTDPGQMNAGNSWIGGPWGGGTPVTASYTADTIEVTFNPSWNWHAQGIPLGGAFPTSLPPFGRTDLNVRLQVEGRVTYNPGMTFFNFHVVLMDTAGGQSTYRFIPDVWNWTSPAPFTTSFAIVSSLRDLSNPNSSAGGGFNWNTGVLSQVHFQFQNAALEGGNPGPNTGAVTFSIDNIQAIPEPTVLAGVLATSLGLLIRRRQK